MLYESYGVGGWLQWGALLAAGIASPLLCANALMSGRPLPTFLELLGPREYRTGRCLTMLLGLVLIVTTLIAAETALGFTFDPRYRDFPFASLTMAVVPFATPDAAQPAAGGRAPDRRSGLCRPAGGRALFTGFNEGSRELAVAVDLRDLSPAGAYAVAGAGRANPKISRPIASPDSTIL